MKKSIIIPLFLFFVLNSNAQEEHPIIGTWQLTTVEVNGETKDGFQAVWIFDKEGVLKAARSTSGKAITVGTWKCDKTRKMLIMESTIDKDFNGEAKVINLKEDKLSYKKEDAILNFKKTEMLSSNKASAKEIAPTLSFTSDDFFNGDEYIDDSERLPWNFEQIYNNMKNIKEMIYDVDHFEPNKGKTDSWINSYKVAFMDEGDLSIREYSYFQKDYIDMSENGYPLYEETKAIKEFYPRSKPDMYKVVGEEFLNTISGELICTVVEAMGDFDQKIKFWMINDKPGVYAKIIIVKDEGNPFDYTNVYTLKEIK